MYKHIATESFIQYSTGDTTVKEESGKVTISRYNLLYKLKKFMSDTYGNRNFVEHLFCKLYLNEVEAFTFFVPEIVYIVDSATHAGYGYRVYFTSILDKLITNTWYKNTQDEIKSIVDLKVLKELKREPLPHQLEFIRDIYWQRKIAFNLKGYLLSLDTGLGKTTTSIMLKECLHKKTAIVIAPLTVAKNVWPDEIKDIVPDVSVWTVEDDISKITTDTNYIVINYEFISKLTVIVNIFNNSDLMIIVDECHNFKDINSKRTQELLELCAKTKCDDILLMSATPIKALGVECLPIFKVLDPLFNRYVEDRVKSMLHTPKIMNELLRNRLGFMMFRILKADVLALPEKHEEEIHIKLKNGDYYTINNIKKLIQQYIDERTKYYESKKDHYITRMREFINIFRKELPSSGTKQFQWYLTSIEHLRKIFKNGTPVFATNASELIREVNTYEKNVLIPLLTSELRKEFRDVKTVYKYVSFKILGEVIGNLLNQLRMSMTRDLIGDEVINTIKSAAKKTILFSSYIDSLEVAEQVCKRAELKPIVINGSNSKDSKAIIDEFKKNSSLNPLIASTKVMSTGHTITEANTVIFLNVPFRSVDYYQASDRVYRIGQDTEVFIYKLVLDTGETPNLSTRMQDILSWSKQQFGEIVGEDAINDEMEGAGGGMISNFVDENIISGFLGKSIIAKLFR